jgi:hypothetical protein
MSGGAASDAVSDKDADAVCCVIGNLICGAGTANIVNQAHWWEDRANALATTAYRPPGSWW